MDGVTIADHEHQVTQQENGEVDPTGDGGSDTPKMANAPQVAAWNSTPDRIPEYVQLSDNRVASRLWVELPDCPATPVAGTDIPLSDDVRNATIATCKVRPPPAA